MTYNWGYITLLSTEDYLQAVLALNESLKRVHSVFPFIVGITDNISKNVQSILISAGCLIEPINTLHYSTITINYTDPQTKSILNTASKIALFDLKHWDKLIYIDADCIVLQNIDDLFNWPDGSMAYNIESDRGFGFTGLMVFCPINHNTEYYKCIMNNFRCYDGNLLGDLWFMTKTNPAYQIPKDYFCNYYPFIVNQKLDPNKREDYKIIHFLNRPKPWVEAPKDDNSWYMHYYLSLLRLVKDKYRI